MFEANRLLPYGQRRGARVASQRCPILLDVSVMIPTPLPAAKKAINLGFLEQNHQKAGNFFGGEPQILAHFAQPARGAVRRRERGEHSNSRRKASLKWLWLEKPVESARSVRSRLFASASCSRAERSRRRSRYR